MKDCIAPDAVPWSQPKPNGFFSDPNTTERWSAAKQGDKIVPKSSLRQSCVCTIKDGLLGWSRGRRNSVSTQSSSDNPFLEYPIELKHEILNHLLRLKPNSRELLKAAELLVASGIPSFDLTCLDDCKFEDVRGILETLIRHGGCLKELTLAGQWMYNKSSPELVHAMLRSCPNLICLKLQETFQNGHELEIALKNCPKLRKLEIMHPSENKLDIIDLIKAMNTYNDYDAAKEHVKELVLPSSVKGKDILQLMETLPNLEYISCTCLDEIIDELEDNCNTPYWRERCSRICGLYVTCPVGEETVEYLVDWFPNLEEVSLELQDCMDIKPIAKLCKLRSLELKNSPILHCCTSFMDEILPLLASCGKKLLSLSLERFDIIDLNKIATYCPNLRSFSAQWFTMLTTSHCRFTKKQFLNLRFLRLRPRVERKVSPEACVLLLTNSHCLNHLEFYSSYGLTDVLLENLLKTNQFTQLRTLLLRHGHGLSSKGIVQLTRFAQNLRVWDVGMNYSKETDA